MRSFAKIVCTRTLRTVAYMHTSPAAFPFDPAECFEATGGTTPLHSFEYFSRIRFLFKSGNGIATPVRRDFRSISRQRSGSYRLSLTCHKALRLIVNYFYRSVPQCRRRSFALHYILCVLLMQSKNTLLAYMMLLVNSNRSIVCQRTIVVQITANRQHNTIGYCNTVTGIHRCIDRH